jgi:hypothetical protein
MAKWILPALWVVAVALESAAAESPPKLAAHDKNALRGWAHVELGEDFGYKITNGVDTILFKRIPPQPNKDYALVRGPDGRDYSIGTVSCGAEAYMVIGDFGGKQDPNTLAPLTTFKCPSDSANAFEFPDQGQFQELVTVREPSRFRRWVGALRGDFGMYTFGDEMLIVQAALPTDDRTVQGRLAYVESVVFGDRQKAHLRMEAKNGVTLYLGRQGSDAVAARFLSCDRGTLLVISKSLPQFRGRLTATSPVPPGREEQAVRNALQVRCRKGNEPSLPSLAIPSSLVIPSPTTTGSAPSP